MLVYAAPVVLSKGLNLLLLPLYISVLSVDDFGRLELLVVSILCLQSLLDLGWSHAYLRLQHASVSSEDLGWTLLASRLALHGLVMLALTLVGAERVGHWVGRSPDWGAAIWCVVLLFALRDLLRFFEVRMRAAQRSVHYAVLQILHMFAQLLGVLWLLLHAQWGVLGVLGGQVIGASVALGIGAALEYRWLVAALTRGSFDRALLRRVLAFGLPIAPSIGVTWLITGSDRYMLSWLLGEPGLHEVAQYGFAARAASVLMLVVSGFSLFFSPEVFRTHAQPGTAARMVTWFRFYVGALFCISSLLVAVVPPLVTSWFPEFRGALVFLPLLLAGAMVHYVGGDFSIGLEIGETTAWRGIAGAIAACVNLLANVALIPLYGGVGACVASVLAYVVLVGLQLPRSQQLYPVPYPWMLWALAVAWIAGASGLVARWPNAVWMYAATGLVGMLLWLRSGGSLTMASAGLVHAGARSDSSTDAALEYGAADAGHVQRSSPSS